MDEMIDDRTAAEVQMLDASLEIVVAVMRKQRLVPPFGLRRSFALDDTRN